MSFQASFGFHIVALSVQKVFSVPGALHFDAPLLAHAPKQVLPVCVDGCGLLARLGARALLPSLHKVNLRLDCSGL
jgi:hypothetical protein